MLPYFNDCFTDGFPHEQGFSFTALSETDDRKWGGFQVRYRKLHNLFSSGFKGQPVLRGYNGLFIRLQRDTTHTVGITGRRSRDRTFPTAKGKVPGGRTTIRKRTIIHQVRYEPVMRVMFQQFGSTMFHFAGIITGTFLADIGFDADSGNKELIIQPAGSGITKQRQGRSIWCGFVGSQV